MPKRKKTQMRPLTAEESLRFLEWVNSGQQRNKSGSIKDPLKEKVVRERLGMAERDARKNTRHLPPRKPRGH